LILLYRGNDVRGDTMTDERKGPGDLVDALTGLAKSVSLDSIPSSAVHAGRRLFLDSVAAILAGMGEPEVQGLAEKMNAASISPCSTIMGSSYKADAMWAALVHATAGVWHDFDGGHRFAGGNPGIYPVAAGLAVAEREGASGRDLLEAIIAGYEVAARVGLGTTLRPGVDSQGSWPLLGAATTAGLLMGYDRPQLRETLNLSTSLTLASSSRAAYEGATVRHAYAGFGSAMGVFAAELVKDGFTAEQDGISTVFGAIAGVFLDEEKAVVGIGKRWEITRGYHKPYACARDIHAALDALRSLSKTESIPCEMVERVEVDTYAMAATMNDTAPENPQAAKLSIPYALACFLVLKEVDLYAYTEKAFGNPQIRSLARKVVVREDRKLTARTPSERPAAVRLVFRDGRILDASAKLPRGEPDHEPLGDEELCEKFIKLGSRTLGRERLQKLLDQLSHIELIPTIHALFS
jgi:2-methylcitrate dehydratase PrpD